MNFLIRIFSSNQFFTKTSNSILFFNLYKHTPTNSISPKTIMHYSFCGPKKLIHTRDIVSDLAILVGLEESCHEF